MRVGVAGDDKIGRNVVNNLVRLIDFDVEVEVDCSGSAGVRVINLTYSLFR